MGSGPAVAPGRRGSTGPGVVLPCRESGWVLVSRARGLAGGDRDGDQAGPGLGPGRGEAQPQAAAAADQPPGGGEQAQAFGFPGAGTRRIGYLSWPRGAGRPWRASWSAVIAGPSAPRGTTSSVQVLSLGGFYGRVVLSSGRGCGPAAICSSSSMTRLSSRSAASLFAIRTAAAR